MSFKIGFDISYNFDEMTFVYGKDTFGPEVERRDLDAIRKSLKDPSCDGPKTVYSIAMDIGRNKDKNDLVDRNLLYGAVIYAKGRLGNEPIRSQGHIHAASKSVGMSTPEIYEIWDGEAFIYMQESAKDNPGRCFAVHAKVGDVVVVPPNWAHSTISANPEKPLVFGAWCVRDYGFEYEDVREHGGMAYFPILNEQGGISWEKNQKYTSSDIIIKQPNKELYKKLFDIEINKSIYEQYLEDNSKFDFVPRPYIKKEQWDIFEP